MVKVEIGNNICQCFNEITNSKIYVQSDEKGIFFNLNDALSIFRMGYKNKKWICDRAEKQGEEIRHISFTRYDQERESTEIFISERMIHEVMYVNRKDLENEEQFIYNIIQDYDGNVCLNYNESSYSTEGRLALERLYTRYDKFLEESQEDFEILEKEDYWNESYTGEFEYIGSFIEQQLEKCKLSYMNEKCPEDLRQEERIKRLKVSEEASKKRHEEFRRNMPGKELGSLTDDDLDAIYNVIYLEE